MELVAGTWTVLVVDDSEDFLVAACSWLETLPGLSLVGTARNGHCALELARRLKPDLVVMDAVMPTMGGFEATRRIKERHDAPRVVVVSLNDSKAMRDEAWVSGADGFVAKADLTAALLPLIQALRSGTETRPLGGPRAGAAGVAGSRPAPDAAARPAPPADDTTERTSVDPDDTGALVRGWLAPVWQGLRARSERALSHLRTRDGLPPLCPRKAYARGGGPSRPRLGKGRDSL
jgi:DNA-binding NarL/FixJ family response regulator